MSQGKETKIPPAPPPPPHHCLNVLESKAKAQVENTSDYNVLGKDELNDCFERLLSSDGKLKKLFYTCNTFLKPQLQEGPKCGLVALSIASSATENFFNVDKIFEKAVTQTFTKQGEIFDVQSLAFLAKECGFEANIIKGGLNMHLCCILKSFLTKSLLLVPYDADFNHSPCCKEGHKAHWAVICGFAIFQLGDEENRSEEDDFLLLNSPSAAEICTCIDNSQRDVDSPLTFSCHRGKILIGKKPRQDIIRVRESQFREGKVYLIGMQGKSKHFGLWPFQDMAESNDNLTHFSTSRDSASYVIPEGGVSEGLKGKAIILKYPTKS